MNTFDEKTAAKAVKWFQQKMGIQDWAVSLEVMDDPPEWAKDRLSEDAVAGCLIDKRYKVASVWVSPKANNERDENCMVSLFHELIHMVLDDVDIEDDGRSDREFVWDRLAGIMADLYNKERRKT